ncbi:MAG TPA: hypothetical protein VLG46_17075 [Anaerolineae bacterium]|nr:hypothetical protein [Anaerolineae bacterium]
MLRKYSVPVLLFTQVIIFLLLLSVFLQQPAASASGESAPQDMPQAQIISHGQYVWSYAAKFVCGFQRTAEPGQVPPGEPILKPGNYATEINIHNPAYKQTPLRKKFLVLVNNQEAIREPSQIAPTKIMTMTLGADYATMDDCNNLWRLTYPTAPLPSPMPVFIGYLVILSPLELDVDVVYTANAPGDLATPPTGISIDVERVTGKRVFLPTGAAQP